MKTEGFAIRGNPDVTYYYEWQGYSEENIYGVDGLVSFIRDHCHDSSREYLRNKIHTEEISLYAEYGGMKIIKKGSYIVKESNKDYYSLTEKEFNDVFKKVSVDLNVSKVRGLAVKKSPTEFQYFKWQGWSKENVLNLENWICYLYDQKRVLERDYEKEILSIRIEGILYPVPKDCFIVFEKEVRYREPIKQMFCITNKEFKALYEVF